MIHIFLDLNFLCDYLSLNGLFYNSVTYQILSDEMLLMLTKRGDLNGIKEYELTLRPQTCTVMLSVRAVYCICIASPVLPDTDALK